MSVTNFDKVLPQEEVHQFFALEGSRLYKKLASGAVTQLKSLDGARVVTIFKGARLVGADIAWCLLYGNWPEFPIAQISSDPLDFSETNLFPARVKRLNYVERLVGKTYFHPLSTHGHLTQERCRKHWEMLAREYYVPDMAYVLRLEAANREMRAKHLAEMKRLSPSSPLLPRGERALRTKRPSPVPGMEWHWHGDAWVSVPIACHVADDYRKRVQAWQAGARTFAFSPITRRVHAYYPDGRECI